MCSSLLESNNIVVSNPSEVRVCDSCVDSFIPELDSRVCAKCNKIYCTHCASKIDTMFCIYCFHDFVMEDTTLTKEIKSKSLKGNKIFIRRMSARHIVFKGEAWMFAQRRVLDMTDDELLASIEYHREIYDQMLNEREARAVAKNRSALKRMVRTSQDQFNPLGAADVLGMQSTTVRTTRRTKTTVVAQGGNDPKIAMQNLINMLKAQGLSQEQIAATLTAMVAKK